MDSVRKILVIQTAFLGDVILATPVASELKRIFPAASIDFIVKKGNETLLHNNPNLRYVIALDKSKGKWRAILPLIKQLRSQKYDLVLNLHRFGSSGIVTTFSGGKLKYGFSKNPFSLFYTKSFPHSIGKNQHEVSRNLSIISEFGAVESKRPELYPSPANFDRIKEFSNGIFFCMAPASVWYTKQLPIGKWVELVKQKSKSGKIYLLGGKADQELCAEILKLSGVPNAENLAGELNLLESAALISKAKRTFVNDSGPLHIASAMNAPVTAFFCSTVPQFGFGPLSDDSEIQEVLDLDCRPCGLHGFKTCPKGHFKCGKGIQINE